MDQDHSRGWFVPRDGCNPRRDDPQRLVRYQSVAGADLTRFGSQRLHAVPFPQEHPDDRAIGEHLERKRWGISTAGACSVWLHRRLLGKAFLENSRDPRVQLPTLAPKQALVGRIPDEERCLNV